MTIRPLGRPDDLGWVVLAHGEVYAAEFGWDATFEALVARIVADFACGRDPQREAAWIAECGSRRVGCVFCVAADERTAQLRILLVHPDARGNGLGARLTAECIRFARSAGYRASGCGPTTRWSPACAVYLAAGFVLVGQDRHTSFGADLVGQTYQLDLAPSVS